MQPPVVKVHVDGLTIWSALLRGTEGPYLEPGGVDGWWGRPVASASSSARPGAHGEFDVPSYMGGRIVTIKGVVESDPLEWDRWCDRLSGVGADGGRVRVVVEEQGRSTWAWCRVLGVLVTRSSALHPPTFTLMLKTANPRRFGEVRDSAPTTTARHTMLNRGNFPAAPRFVVTGPQPGGYSIVADGRPNWQVNSALPSGQVDVVDFATGRVMRGPSAAAATTPVVGAVPSPRPWLVPGGGEQTWYAAPSGAAGSIRGFITDTFV